MIEKPSGARRSWLKHTAFLAIGCVLSNDYSNVASAMTLTNKQLADWTGTFSDGSQTYVLSESGAFTWSNAHLPGGTDMAIQINATGTVRLSDGWLQFVFDTSSFRGERHNSLPTDFRAPSMHRYWPIKLTTATYLLDESALNSVINEVNGLSQASVNIGFHLRRSNPIQPSASVAFIDPRTTFPQAYRSRLLAKPLLGRITALGPITKKQVNTAGWMQPPIIKTQYSALVTINLGSRQGGFVGMRLYIDPNRLPFEVEKISEDHCEGAFSWLQDAPKLGDLVRSNAQ